MNKNLSNKITLILSKGINLIFTEYPLRTTMGFIVGVFLSTIFNISKPLLSNISFLDLNSLELWNFIVIGVLILHISTLYEKLSNKAEFDENTEKAFKLIKKAQENGLEEEKIKLMYQKLCEKSLDVIIDQEEKKASTRDKKEQVS